MKKITILFISLFGIALSSAFAQTIDKAQIEVYYQYEMVNNQLTPQKKSKDEVLLLIGEKYTHCYSYLNFLHDSLLQANPAEYRSQVATSEGKILTPKPGETMDEMKARGGVMIVPARSRLKSNIYNKEHYYIQRATGELTCLNAVLDMKNPPIVYCTYKEKLVKPKWIISEERQMIAGYNSQKATAHYGGRDWTVWFSPEIPIDGGPWILRGLPGLIVKAETADGEFLFVATSVNRSSQKVIAKDKKQSYRELPKKEMFRLKADGFLHPQRPFEYNGIEILD